MAGKEGGGRERAFATFSKNFLLPEIPPWRINSLCFREGGREKRKGVAATFTLFFTLISPPRFTFPPEKLGKYNYVLGKSWKEGRTRLFPYLLTMKRSISYAGNLNYSSVFAGPRSARALRSRRRPARPSCAPTSCARSSSGTGGCSPRLRGEFMTNLYVR